MENAIQKLDNTFSITGQVSEHDLNEIAAAGFKSIICCRPDGEGGDTQPSHLQLQEASSTLGLSFEYVPVIPNQIRAEDADRMAQLLQSLPMPILGYCRTGNRAKQLYQMAKNAAPHTKHESETSACNWTDAFDVVVIGGGAAGIGVTASLLKRRQDLRIAIIEPNEVHYYQPAWTLVGAGAFDVKRSQRPMQSVIPKKAFWIQGRVGKIDPAGKRVLLEDGRAVEYHQLIVCPGLVLDWEAIEGLSETLGQHGVTSNYRVDLAPYTWKIVKNLRFGKALFTQPPMPIKCAGAPQKAMYLSCSHWKKVGTLNNIDVEFNNAGAVLFGVAHFVPSLMRYVEQYGAKLTFNSTLESPLIF